MTGLLTILLLTGLQLLAGFGLLTLSRLWLKPGLFLPLAVLTGVGIFSVIPFILQLLYVSLTATNIFISLAAACIFLNFRIREGIRRLQNMIQHTHFGVRIYELPFLLVLAAVMFLSVWRCYYYPPTPRDLTSGAEVVAEYAVKEKTMINSVFTVDLETTNNPFKPPFVTSLQIIYKYAGFPFGQVWLSAIFICFIFFLYQAISSRIHRSIAGLLIVVFIVIPEMYAYTFMALFDYSNAVYFCLSVYFFIGYLRTEERNQLVLSGFFMGIATYIRSETLILAVFFLPLLLWFHIRNWNSLSRIVKDSLVFLLPAALLYLLSVVVYLNYYLPVAYDFGDLVNKDLVHIDVLVQRFADMNTKLIFSESGVNYYGYFFLIFIILLLFDLSLYERWKGEPRQWLYAVMVVYFGLPLLGYLLPLMDLDNSTKRGLFKIFPPMLFYMANSGLLTDISKKISKWERRA
jgi:hypothetical protein